MQHSGFGAGAVGVHRVETIGKIRRPGLRDGARIRGLARSLPLARHKAIARWVHAMAEGSQGSEGWGGTGLLAQVATGAAVWAAVWAVVWPS